MHTVTGQTQVSIFIALLFFQNYVVCEENTKNSLYSEFKLDFEIAFEGNLSTVRSHRKHVVCIVNAWSYWRPGKGHYDFTGDHFDGNLCTHIVYRSIHLNNDTYGLKLKDEHLDMTIGYIKKMAQLKNRFPRLKSILSIGGHNEGASTFSAIAATKSKRQLFIRNATESTRKFGFDGLMLDWQYPKYDDKLHFTMLSKELKAECQKMNLILATTLSGDKEVADLGYEIGKINKIFDLILIMSFDYSGPWDKRTGFNAPLKYKKGSDTVEETLQHLLEKGADPNVLVLGVPLYGRPYLLESKDFSNPAKLGLDSPNGFMGPWTNQDDMLGYHEICGSYLMKNTNGDNVWKAYWDSNALVPFATNGSHWISFDNPLSIFGKVLVATSNKFGLSGIMAWSIDTDDFLGLCSHFPYSLLRTINYALWVGTTNELVSKSLICSLYNTKGNLAIPLQNQLKPSIISEIENISVPLNSDEPIECIAEGNPPPEIIWLKSERKETRIRTSVEEIDIVKDLRAYGAGSLCGPYKSGSTLTLKNFTEKQAGNYICVAKNIFGEKRIEFVVSLEKYILKTEEIDDSQMPLGWGWIAGIFIALINLTAIVYYLKQKFSKDDQGLTSKEIKEFMEGENYRKLRKNGNRGPAIPDEAPYNMSYEIFTNDYETDEDRLLGSGAFGIVFMGRVKGNDVAVKSIKQGAEKHYLKSLMTELKVLIHLEKHPNIVNLVGASTIRLNTGLLYIFVEYCPLGNMQIYLRQCRGSLINLIQNDIIEPNLESLYQVKEDMITTKDLLNWSCQISKALEHLSLKKVIHGDLAARNILLYKRDLIKLTDFGLSRKLYDYANYVKTNQEPLPWRWMSIESLRDLTFSTQSDVWSFGITVWEIFSLGETPYSGISWTTDFVDKLSQQNLRIHQPRYCTTSIYDFLCQCWTENPQDRPTAEDLRLYFETILTEKFSEDYTDVKLD